MRSTPVQSLAALVGAVFLAVGVLGFIPGITTHYGDLSFAGDGSTAKLLGVFQVSVLHNIVHVLFGLAGLALARTWDGARTFLIGGGVVYLVLWILGLDGGDHLACGRDGRDAGARPVLRGAATATMMWPWTRFRHCSSGSKRASSATRCRCSRTSRAGTSRSTTRS